MHAPVALVVLAGGKSSRMGADKRYLRLHGVTLLERACQLANDTLTHAGCSGQVVISGHAHHERFRVIPDRLAEKGPLEAIASVMHALGSSCERFVYLPVDMVLLEADDLVRLLQATTPAAHFHGYELPLSLHLSVLAEVDEAARSHRRSVRSLIERLHARALEPPSESHMQNFNTPEDWARLASTLRTSDKLPYGTD